MDTDQRQAKPDSPDKPDVPVICQGGFLFGAGAFALICGLVIPIPSVAIDILFVFAAFLVLAIVSVSFFGKKAEQLQGLAQIVIAGVVLRIFLAASSAKILLTASEPGYILAFTAKVVMPLPFLCAGMLVIAALISTFGTISMVRRSLRTVKEFTARVFRAAMIYLQTALETGLLNKTSFDDLQKKTVQQADFFISTAAAFRFLFCESLVLIILFIFSLAASVLVSTDTSLLSDEYARLICSISAGMSMIILLGLINTAALKTITKKTFDLSSSISGEFITTPETIKVKSVVNNTAPNDQPPAHTNEAENSQPTPTPSITDDNIKDSEWFDSNSKEQIKPTAKPAEFWKASSFKNTKAYTIIAEIIADVSLDKKRIVLAVSDSLGNLPVTIPVNIAAETAHLNKKTLLVDLDFARNSIAKVFNLANQTEQPRHSEYVINTEMKNLAVIPASALKPLKMLKTLRIIKNVAPEFDRTIIYIPDITVDEALIHAAGLAETAMLFANDNSTAMAQIRKDLSITGCDFMEPSETLIDV